MVKKEWSVTVRWFSGPDNDTENETELTADSKEEIIEKINAYDDHIELEAERASKVIPDESEEGSE